MKRYGLLAACAYLFAILLVDGAGAQAVRGRIEGTVRDPQGQLIPNATITLTNLGTGETRTAVSSGEGVYVAVEVKPGAYRVTAEATGFKKITVEGIVVQVATVATVNLELPVGAASESITVNASESQEVVNSANPEVGDVVDRQRILDLPLDGRNPLELTALQAGVQLRTNADGEIDRFSINGNRTVANNITVDGVNASDNFLKTPANVTLPVIPVSVESIGEFRVTTALPSAEFGRGTAQVNAITASGTNQLRGSLFEFHRNTVFNANTFFNNSTVSPATGETLPREKLIRNQFGGRLGGPVTLPKWLLGPFAYNGKDRTFFFFSYEGKRESRGLSRNRTVYTSQARQGIFRYLNGLPTTPANVAANPGLVRSVNVLGLNATRATLDPLVSRYLALTPTPNNFQLGDGLNTGGYRFNSTILSPSDVFAGRLDHRLTAKHSLEATFSYGDVNFLGDYINEGEPAFPDAPYRTRNTLGRGASITLRSTLAPQVINEARFGAQLSTLTFGNTATFPEGYQVDFGTIFDPVNDFLGSGRNLRVLQFTDNLTWIRGSHTIKTGAELRSLWVHRYTFADTLPRADFSTAVNDPGFTRTTQFPGSTTADFNNARTLANNITGAIGSVFQTFNVLERGAGFVPGAPEVREYSNREADFYAQDTWRFRPNLTLSLGVRYEYQTAPRELNGLALLPVGGSAGLYGISGKGNLFQPGTFSGPATTVLDYAGELYKADRNNFAPILGFAWDPFRKGKTSLRGGYRISYVRGSFNTIDGTLDDNEGLILTTQRNLGGFLRNGIAPAPVPTVSIPATQSIQVSSTVDVRAFDENLRTPYVQEWTFSVQHEVLRNTSLEVRYVGNRGIKLYRGYDINEVNILARDSRTGQTFLDAFRIAQNNLEAFKRARPTATPNFKYDAAIAGSRPNPLFDDVLFRGRAASEFQLTNYVQRLEEGRAGDFADYVSRVRLANGRRGDPFYAAVAAGLLPVNFFRANPNVRGAQLFGNASFSTYHALQIELQRRLAGGARFQVNYSFAKGLSDFIGSTGDTNSFLTLRNTRLETGQFNNTHQLTGNFIYQLPVGRGRRFLKGVNGLPGHLLSGWQLGGIMRYNSGDPLSLLSQRGTFNRDDRSALNSVDVAGNLSREDLQKLATVRTTSIGVVYFDPNLAPGTSSDPSKILFLNPGPGTNGTLGLSSIFGPRFWNFDFSTLKRTRLTEDVNLEFRAEIFNLFNTVNFDNPVTTINSANFGRITSITGRPRLMQFALRLNF
ncbi:MAG: TonB-dependent receptor [Blastocatellia bacterium]|nr:TonB-dependent receptor [Blastocatellia bacterium]